MSQKIQFIATVLAKPRLLILDEPFSGQDPVNLEVLRDALLEMRRAGTTVIFSTHDMHIAERLCDHICMIYKGRKVLDGTLDAIQATYGQDTLRLHFQDDRELRDGQIPGATHVRHTGRFWEMRYSGNPHEALQAAMQAGRVDHFEVVHPSLHDIFVRIAQPAGLTEAPIEGQEAADA
jgi:ABC-2 type transport system ATP-binding protein